MRSGPAILPVISKRDVVAVTLGILDRILRSPDLRHWEHTGFVFRRGRRPPERSPGENIADFWAPELHRVGDGYLLCFTASNAERALCIGLARSDHPKARLNPIPSRCSLAG